MRQHNLFSLTLYSILLIVSIVACQTENTTQETSTTKKLGPNQVTVVPVELRDFQPHFQTTGTLHPKRHAQLRALVGGEISKIPVDIGSVIQEGSLLFQIRQIDFQLALDQMEANWEQANVVLKDRKREKIRMENLYSEGFATEKMRDQAITAFEQAVAALNQTQAAKNTALQALKDTTAYAPYNGAVTARFMEAGEFIARGDPVLEIMDLTILNAEIEIPERYAGQLTISNKVDVHVTAVNKTYEGTITAINPKIDISSRTFLIKIAVLNQSLELQAGLFCTVDINLSKQMNRLAIPNKAIIRDEGRSTVWIIENGEAWSRIIEEGTSVDGQILVLDGLDIGDQVVVEGFGGLKEGSEVVVNSEV